MYGDPWVERWAVYEQRSLEGVEPGPPDEDGQRWYSLADRVLADGVLTGFKLSTCNCFSHTPEDYEVEFGPDEREQAEALCEEFNRYEWQGPLDPDFEERRERLKQLGHSFRTLFEEPPVARWPVRPGKYLVHDGGVGWHPEPVDHLADDLNAVREIIAEDEGGVYSVVDLDTGQALAFERSVSVEIAVEEGTG